jgi:hypothetical protein
MSQWDERVESHPATQGLQALESKLAGAEAPDDPAGVEALERLKRVVTYLAGLFDRSDAWLVTPSILDNLNTQITSLSSHVDSFISSKDATNLTNANSYADAALDVARGWPVTQAQESEELSKSANSFRKSAGDLIKGLNQDSEETRTDLDRVRKKLTDVRTEATTQVDELKGQLSAVGSQIDAEKVRVDETITQFQSQFSEGQEARRAEHEKSVSEQKENFQKQLEETVSESTRQGKEAKEEADALVGVITKLRDQAAKLVGVIGTTGMTGGFQKYANDQKSEADRWRWIAVVAFSLLAIVGLWLVATAGVPNFSWPRFAAKAFVSAPLIALAGYASKQSHDHRLAERAARQFELEVAALDPYIALLPPERQIIVKEEMARKIFGRVVEPPRHKGPPAIEIEELIRKAVDIAVKAAIEPNK